MLFQLVLVRGGGAEYNVTVGGDRASSNITNLEAGVMYTMRIVTVAEDGQMSFPSLSALAMTQLPCKLVFIVLTVLPYRAYISQIFRVWNC